MRRSKCEGLTRPAIPKSHRSKKNGTIATWHTNRRLTIVGTTALPESPLRALPLVGQGLSAARPRRGFLRYRPHAEALRGTAAAYEFTLLRRKYEVRVAPRYDRRKRIVGVRGSLRLLGNDPAPSPVRDLALLKDIRRRRRRNSVESAVRSLELAKAMADTARVNAEIRNERAAAAQEKAVRAMERAEAEERRARLLADSSALLDSSFDRREALDRLMRLIVLRSSDWAVLYFAESDRLRREGCHHRDGSLVALLDAAFPHEDFSRILDSGFPGSGLVIGSGRTRWELFPTVAPEDIHALGPDVARRRALKELGIQSLIRVPIQFHRRVTGVLIVGSGDPGRLYNLQDLQMFRDLAVRIALARESSMLYEEAQREIAMRKEIEARMRVLNSELERRVSDRTRLLEEATREANSFAYTVAHDLRAPLRAITGFCQALKEDYAASVDAMGQDYLDRIVTGARKMDELIRDLLDYARINRADIKRTFVDLDAVADEVLHAMTPELQERKAEVRVEKPLGRVFAHGPVLVQVLTNLMSNAVKFVAPGVRPVVEIRGERRGTRVRLLFRDNGIGVAPQHQERIFGIFERLNRAEEYPGTGIGLAIVRRAMERLGGTVGLVSTPAEGSTFWIELPSA